MGGGYHGGFNYNSSYITRKIDFYVGENGKALPGKYKKWIGVSRRESLLKKSKNEKLRNAIRELYHEGSFIGDGGTATALKFEKRTGLNLGRRGNSHYQKALGMANHISKKVLKEPLKNSERKIAEKMLRKLQKSIVEWRA